MSFDLYPTPTRLDLLREVAAGNVVEGITDDPPVSTWLTHEYEPEPRKVTARIQELERAGWVSLPNGRAFWTLTEAGQAILDGAS